METTTTGLFLNKDDGTISSSAARPGSVIVLKHTAEWESGYGTAGSDKLGSLEFHSGDSSGGTGLRASIVGTVDSYFNSNSLTFNVGLTNSTTIQEAMRIDPNSIITMPKQPAFQVIPATQQSNIAINSNVTVVFGTERFDNNADFAGNSFAAPVTGKYQFNCTLYLNNIDTAADYYELRLTTSNKTYFTIISPEFTGDLVYFSLSRSVLADMDESDTCFIALSQSAGTAQTDITVSSTFSGYLVA